MPASKQDKVQVACPHCGHLQLEPRTAFSTVCKKCHGHFRLEEEVRPTPKRQERVPELKHVTCFECGTELEVPASAQSTMCKRCSRYMDLKDYLIDKAASKNFKTKGTFTIELSGYVFNTETVAGDVVLKGRLLGKVAAEKSLTIYSTAEIKGSFKAHRLVLGADEHTYWGPAQEMRGIRTAVGLLEQITAELDVSPARVACIGTSNAAALAALTGLAFGAGVLILGGPPLAMGTLLGGWATVERREGGKPMVSASHLLGLARRDGGPDPVDWLNGLLPSLAAECPRPCRVRLFASPHDFVFPGCLEFFQQRELWPNVEVELDLSEAETHDASAKEFYDKFLVRAVREELVMTADPV